MDTYNMISYWYAEDLEDGCPHIVDAKFNKYLALCGVRIADPFLSNMKEPKEEWICPECLEMHKIKDVKLKYGDRY